MNLLCRLGRHRPGGIPRWNDGFYFATCENCGCDLVRTAFQGWHVPKGYKVVWSERPPVSRPDVLLVPSDVPADPVPAGQVAAPSPIGADEPVAPALGQDVDNVAGPASFAGGPGTPSSPAASPADEGVRSRLPIEDVLAHLAAEEADERAAAPTPEAAAEPPPPPAPPPPPPPRRKTWDFMDDDFAREDPAPRRSQSEAGPALGSTDEPPPAMAAGAAEEDSAQQPDGSEPLAPPRSSMRSAVREFWSGPAQPNPRLAIALAAAVAVAVAVAMVFAGPKAQAPAGAPESTRDAGLVQDESDAFAASAPEEGSSAPPAAGPQEPPQPATAARSDRAYVAASLLSCRAAPALQARRVRSLGRGEEVRILGMEGGWVSLASHGGQCWAQARYISPAPPL